MGKRRLLIFHTFSDTVKSKPFRLLVKNSLRHIMYFNMLPNDKVSLQGYMCLTSWNELIFQIICSVGSCMPFSENKNHWTKNTQWNVHAIKLKRRNWIRSLSSFEILSINVIRYYWPYTTGSYLMLCLQNRIEFYATLLRSALITVCLSI